MQGRKFSHSLAFICENVGFHSKLHVCRVCGSEFLLESLNNLVAMRSYHRLHVFKGNLFSQHHLVEGSDEKT